MLLIMIESIISFVFRNNSPWFYRNSKVNFSKFLKIPEKIFLWNYIHGNVVDYILQLHYSSALPMPTYQSKNPKSEKYLDICEYTCCKKVNNQSIYMEYQSFVFEIIYVTIHVKQKICPHFFIILSTILLK